MWQGVPGWRIGGHRTLVEQAFLTDAGGVHRVAVDPTVQVGPIQAAYDAEGWLWVHAEGATHRLTPLSRRAAMERRLAARDAGASAAAPELRAPMPGAVVAVHVTDGAVVAAGDRIVTIEAMKMEHPVTAPHDGVVRLEVAVGDQVRRDQVLAHVTAHEAD